MKMQHVPGCYTCHVDTLMNGLSMLLQARQCCSSRIPNMTFLLADKLRDCLELAHTHTVQRNTSQ